MMMAADAASWAALVLGLGLATAHVAWLVPRLRPAAAWGLTVLLAAIAAVLALRADGVWWLPLTAVLWGHAGQAFAHRGRAVPAAAPVPAPAAAPASPGAPPKAHPATLGRYRIDSQIGRGSMGAVYLGHDPQIGRQVAVKTLALGREFGGDQLAEARARFFREAETAGRLQHPDIVTIFDAGEAQDLAWIAMEVVRGHDLQRHASPGQLLPVPAVLAIVARVADALAYAHSQGVVHRDIKPANVMVDPETGLVKVMDFGVARIGDTSRTRTGLVLGTPSYMSPEQLAGRRADARSDLYALGVMLFQLLTGALPHQGDSMARLMHQITNEPAPDVRTLRPELPEALANVVALALALEKRPEVRYADGRQLAADLRAIAAALEAPEGVAFAKTVTFSRDEPRHNSEP